MLSYIQYCPIIKKKVTISLLKWLLSGKYLFDLIFHDLYISCVDCQSYALHLIDNGSLI